MEPSDFDLRVQEWITRVKQLARKSVPWLAGTVVLIVVCAALWTLVLKPRPGPVERPPATVPEQTESSTPSRLDYVRALYGPWETVANDAVSNRVAFVTENGTLQLGSQAMRPDEEWKPTDVVRFTAIERNGNTFRFRVLMDNGTLFTFSANQAFILASQPDRLYAFNNEGVVVSRPTPEPTTNR